MYDTVRAPGWPVMSFGTEPPNCIETAVGLISCREKSSASDQTVCPAGMVTFGIPPKVKALSVAVSIAPLLLLGSLVVFAMAMCTLAISTGPLPRSFESWIRICEPETVGHTNWRSVFAGSGFVGLLPASVL